MPTRPWLGPYLERRERRRPDALVRAHRRRLLAGLHGHVLEIGCGEGRNFEHYPTTVTRVLAIEPDDHARRVADGRAAAAPVPIEVRAAGAESVPAVDASFDAVVACWVLCTVPDQRAALAEIRRVLKPDGELRVYEHVRSPNPLFASFQRALDASRLAPALYGCDCARTTDDALRAAGFSWRQRERIFHSSSPLTLPTAPHVFGVMRR